MWSSYAHEVTIEKALYNWLPEKRQEVLLDTDMLLIAIYINSSRMSRWLVYLFLAVKPGRKYAPISKLKS